MIDSSLTAHVRWLDSCRDEMLELLIRLCDTNSGTRNLAGLAAVRQMLAQTFQPLGGEQSVHDIDPLESVDDAGNLVCEPLGQLLQIIKYPDRRPRVILCIHMDTVYSAASTFQKCSWIDPNRLNGPGVIDAKGGLVVMLFALRALEQSPLAGKIGWQVIINPDEEIGSPGSNRLIRQAAAAADWGLLFEPTLPNGSLVSTRKGTGNFVFVVRGKSVHSGRDFENGRNAVVALCRLMTGIHHLNGDPDVTLNVGRVSGGEALNVVPDLAIGRVNVRVRTQQQGLQVVERLQQLVRQASTEDGIRVEMRGDFTSPPKELIPGTEILQRRIESAGELVGLPVTWQPSGGASDGNKFAAAGLPNIDSLGPGGAEIHSHNEFLQVDTLVPRAQLAALVLLSMADHAGRS